MPRVIKLKSHIDRICTYLNYFINPLLSTCYVPGVVGDDISLKETDMGEAELNK